MTRFYYAHRQAFCELYNDLMSPCVFPKHPFKCKQWYNWTTHCGGGNNVLYYYYLHYSKNILTNYKLNNYLWGKDILHLLYCAILQKNISKYSAFVKWAITQHQLNTNLKLQHGKKHNAVKKKKKKDIIPDKKQKLTTQFLEPFVKLDKGWWKCINV